MGEDIQNIHRVSNVIRGTPWIVQMIKNNSQMSKKIVQMSKKIVQMSKKK